MALVGSVIIDPTECPVSILNHYYRHLKTSSPFNQMPTAMRFVNQSSTNAHEQKAPTPSSSVRGIVQNLYLWCVLRAPMPKASAEPTYLPRSAASLRHCLAMKIVMQTKLLVGLSIVTFLFRQNERARELYHLSVFFSD